MYQIDVLEEAEKQLSQLPYALAIPRPEQWNKLPVVSFYDLNTSETFSTDNKGDIATGIIAIDIWTKTVMQGSVIAKDVLSAMEAADWWCELNRFADKTDGVYHRTMRFGKNFII